MENESTVVVDDLDIFQYIESYHTEDQDINHPALLHQHDDINSSAPIILYNFNNNSVYEVGNDGNRSIADHYMEQ